MRYHTIWAMLLALALTACPAPPPQQIPPPTVSEDPTLKPSVPLLPPIDASGPRPVVTVRDTRGNQADFVENELVLATDDSATLNAFLARWQGTVLNTFDPAAEGLTGMTKQHLVRVKVDSADIARLSTDLRTLDADSRGALAVSSAAAHKLLAAAARESTAGLTVGVNWVSRGDVFTDRTTIEAPAGDSIGGTAYTVNTFNWPYMSSGSTQDIGVTEAWRALELAGKLSNKVKIGILDMGYQPDADFPPGWQAVSNIPFVNPVGSKNLIGCGGSDCPWHGTNVAHAAAAVPDNAHGAAGPAGPVADLVLIHTSYDYATAIVALVQARARGAKIINMSFSAPVPAVLFWTALPFEVATRAVRASGALLFASAGNDGKNVEAEDCFIKCWEETWHVPCENGGVICVGGLANNSKNRDNGSNYSSDDGGDSDGDVEIFAPFTVWVGPDPENPTNRARRISGTSFSSPFAAGVAALIWAAKPSLSAGEVEDILKETAHTSPDPKVGKYVNALGAVRRVLGNIPPNVEINTSGTVQIGLPGRLEATVFDFEDPFPCCTITWASSLEGNLGSGRSVDFNPTTLGNRTITVTATDSGGASSTVSRTINVVNTPPIVAINAPFGGQQFFRGVSSTLRGVSSDPNEPNFQLACANLRWTSSVAADAFPKTGCDVAAVFMSNGARTLTLTGNDSHGSSASVTVNINVIDPPANLPPVVNLTSPQNGITIGPDTVIKLIGTATDPEGGAVTLSWDVTTGYNPATGTGFQTLPVTPAANGDWKYTNSVTLNGCEVNDTIRLRLKAKDPQGNEGFDFVVIKVIRIC
jgi:hypothetical protein